MVSTFLGASNSFNRSCDVIFKNVRIRIDYITRNFNFNHSKIKKNKNMRRSVD